MESEPFLPPLLCWRDSRPWHGGAKPFHTLLGRSSLALAPSRQPQAGGRWLGLAITEPAPRRPQHIRSRFDSRLWRARGSSSRALLCLFIKHLQGQLLCPPEWGGAEAIRGPEWVLTAPVQQGRGNFLESLSWPQLLI